MLICYIRTLCSSTFAHNAHNVHNALNPCMIIDRSCASCMLYAEALPRVPQVAACK